MKRSSAAENEYKDSSTTTESIEDARSIGETLSAVATGTLTSDTLFRDLGSVHAITSRQAGRLNASKISPQEHESYLQERQRLLDKKFAGTITKKDLNRLEYVRWSLDRIEDAKYGEALDVLAGVIGQYEQFSGDLLSFSKQLTQTVEGERDRQRQHQRRR